HKHWRKCTLGQSREVPPLSARAFSVGRVGCPQTASVPKLLRNICAPTSQFLSLPRHLHPAKQGARFGGHGDVADRRACIAQNPPSQFVLAVRRYCMCSSKDGSQRAKASWLYPPTATPTEIRHTAERTKYPRREIRSAPW